jgi:hypothetical protein
MSDESPRRYSEREIGDILKRATERQAERDEMTASVPAGLTLEEIEQIAREVGVDADLVRSVAADMSAGSLPEEKWRILGGPLKTEHLYKVDGSATDKDLDALVAEIREHLGIQGRFEKLNGSLTWNGADTTNLEISVVPEGTQTRIQGKQHFGSMAMVFFFLPLFFTLVIGSGYLAEEVGMPALLEFALLMGALLIAFGGGRIGFKRWTRHQRDKMATLVQHLGELLEMSSAPLSVTESAPVPAELEMSEERHQDAPEHLLRRSSTR